MLNHDKKISDPIRKFILFNATMGIFVLLLLFIVILYNRVIISNSNKCTLNYYAKFNGLWSVVKVAKNFGIL